MSGVLWVVERTKVDKFFHCINLLLKSSINLHGYIHSNKWYLNAVPNSVKFSQLKFAFLQNIFHPTTPAQFENLNIVNNTQRTQVLQQQILLQHVQSSAVAPALLCRRHTAPSEPLAVQSVTTDMQLFVFNWYFFHRSVQVRPGPLEEPLRTAETRIFYRQNASPVKVFKE